MGRTGRTFGRTVVLDARTVWSRTSVCGRRTEWRDKHRIEEMTRRAQGRWMAWPRSSKASVDSDGPGTFTRQNKAIRTRRTPNIPVHDSRTLAIYSNKMFGAVVGRAQLRTSNDNLERILQRQLDLAHR